MKNMTSQNLEEFNNQFTLNEDYNEVLYEKTCKLYQEPFLKLVQNAAAVHQQYWPEADIQKSALLSIKTGHCPEDCSYCPQSARYNTGIDTQDLLNIDSMVHHARIAQKNGAERFCMGAAWRKPPRGEQFERVLEAVKQIKNLGLETCVTLGLLNEEQTQKLKEAGLDYYNHNVDTSKDFYKSIITTRKFSDRVNTLKNLRKYNINICCGGILGMGESAEDRIKLIAFLASMDPHPESVPINLLVKFDGTPVSHQKDLDVLEFIRTIAVARIMMPKTRLRLSAGRAQLSREAQVLAFVAGANSVHFGEKLLTSELPGYDFDKKLLTEMTMPTYVPDKN